MKITKPAPSAGNRTFVYKWFVRTNDEGKKVEAHLHVSHISGRGYYATLYTVETDGVFESFAPFSGQRVGAPEIVKRYNVNNLKKYADLIADQLVERVNANDPLFQRFFDKDSASLLSKSA
jgi:hypothetical protein